MWKSRGFKFPSMSLWCVFSSPSGKKFRSKPQLARYLGSSMDLGTFDFRTGKMLMNKMNKNRQRMRYDCSNQAKVRLSGPGASLPRCGAATAVSGREGKCSLS